MHAFRSLSCLLLAFGLVAGTTTAHASPDPNHFQLLTDPAELALRGFDPDGPPVYLPRNPPVADAAEQAHLQGALAERGQAPGTGWVTVSATDFQFEHDQVSYSLYQAFNALTCSDSHITTAAWAPVHLENDRRPRFLDVWVHDSSANTHLNARLMATCTSPAQPHQLNHVVLAETDSSTLSGDARLSAMIAPGAHHVNNHHCAYSIVVRYVSCAGGPALQLRKARVIWD